MIRRLLQVESRTCQIRFVPILADSLRCCLSPVLIALGPVDFEMVFVTLLISCHLRDMVRLNGSTLVLGVTVAIRPIVILFESERVLLGHGQARARRTFI